MILIVDDDKAIRQSLALVLKRRVTKPRSPVIRTRLRHAAQNISSARGDHGYELFLSTTGEEGIYLLRQTKYSSLTHL